MRISSANIPVQTVKPSSSANAQKAVERIDRRQGRAADSYAKNAQPPVIDAEYVEIYSPASRGTGRERTNLDLTLEPETSLNAAMTNAPQSPKLSKYQQQSTEPTPLPGSFIDIFA